MISCLAGEDLNSDRTHSWEVPECYRITKPILSKDTHGQPASQPARQPAKTATIEVPQEKKTEEKIFRLIYLY
jgi:hypothetical protein